MKTINPYAKYLIDDSIKKEGRLYEDDNVRIRVTFAGPENSRYEKLLKNMLKPFETQIKGDDFSDERFMKVLAKVYAICVVLSWEVKAYDEPDENGKEDEEGHWVSGIHDAEGNIMEYNEENVIKGFDLGKRLFQDVIKVASNFNLFRQGQKADDVKN